MIVRGFVEGTVFVVKIYDVGWLVMSTDMVLSRWFVSVYVVRKRKYKLERRTHLIKAP
jgi:hypothetical protein